MSTDDSVASSRRPDLPRLAVATSISTSIEYYDFTAYAIATGREWGGSALVAVEHAPRATRPVRLMVHGRHRRGRSALQHGLRAPDRARRAGIPPAGPADSLPRQRDPRRGGLLGPPQQHRTGDFPRRARHEHDRPPTVGHCYGPRGEWFCRRQASASATTPSPTSERRSHSPTPRVSSGCHASSSCLLEMARLRRRDSTDEEFHLVPAGPQALTRSVADVTGRWPGHLSSA